MDVVVLVTDLIFATKIRSTAEEVGVGASRCRVVSCLGELSEVLSQSSPSLVVIDLNASCADVVAAVEVAKAHRGPKRVVAYGSHVEAEVMRRAEAAGADIVWPRSKFSFELPRLLEDAKG